MDGAPEPDFYYETIKKDRISEEVRERVHKEVKEGYCVIHVDAAGI